MPASLESIRREMKIQPTPQDKGLVMTIEVTAYDNGIMMVNGRPVNWPDAIDNWTGVGMVIAQHMHEFSHAVRDRAEESRRSA